MSNSSAEESNMPATGESPTPTQVQIFDIAAGAVPDFDEKKAEKANAVFILINKKYGFMFLL